MSLKQSGNILLPFAAGLGIFQGLVWIILPILGIAARFTNIDNATIPSHSQRLSNSLTLLMQNDLVDVPLKSNGLFAVTIVYLVLSIIWVLLSLMLFFIIRARRHEYLDGVKMGWGVMTLFTCIYDVIVTGMLGANYQKYLDRYHNNNQTLSDLYTLIACGILFSLAARGYVLWIINLVVAILMLKSGRNQMVKANTGTYDSSSVDAFDDVRNYSSHTNHGYGWENEESKNEPRTLSGIHRNHPAHTNHGSGLENEVSRFDSRPPSGNFNYPGGNNFRAQTDRVAGLGKQDPRSYPKNVLPPNPPNNYRYSAPNIPQPDYNSPSQQLKPAMKQFPPPPPNPKFNRNALY